MQTFFPVYPADTKMINSKIGIKIIQCKVLYFNTDGPIYDRVCEPSLFYNMEISTLFP